jgi:hypothetical protein
MHIPAVYLTSAGTDVTNGPSSSDGKQENELVHVGLLQAMWVHSLAAIRLTIQRVDVK